MGHAVSLYELLVYLRNFFPGLHWQFTGEEITGNRIVIPGLETGDLLRLLAIQPGTIAGKCGSKQLFGRKMTNLRLIAKPVRVLMDRWSWESESGESHFPYPSTRKTWASITLWGTLYRAYLPGLGYRSAPGLRALSTPWTATKPGQKLSWATLFLQHWGQ